MSEEEGRAAFRENERRSELLLLLSEFTERAARAASAQAETGAEPTRSILSVVIMVLLRTAGRLVMLSVRVWTGRGFPTARKPRPAGQDREPGQPAAEPRERSAWEESRFADLVALGIPGAEEMRAELAALLADPGTAELVASEPAVWRAAFDLARVFGLPIPPRPAAEPEADELGADEPEAARPEQTKRAARPAPAAPPAPPPRPPFQPGVVRAPAAEPPHPMLRPGGSDPPAASFRSRLLRSAHGWA